MCKVRKHVVYDFKKLSNWLKPDRTNIAITNLVFFTSPRKLDRKLKIIQTQKRFYENNSVNYLGFQMDKSLTWKQQLNHMAMKVNEANPMVSKLRYFWMTELRDQSVEFHLCYASLSWPQNTN